MTTPTSTTASSKGLTVRACAGDRCVMLAFNLDDKMTDLLAGFAVARRQVGAKKWNFLGNRLSFTAPPAAPSQATPGQFFSSDLDPFQKFWWLDFPEDDQFGACEYQVTVKRFKNADVTLLRSDQRVKLAITVGPFRQGAIEVGFTRGYLSSQAYADRFDNAPYQSFVKTGWRFDTAPFQAQWAWLGGHARQAVVDFLVDCRGTPGATLDAFVYDLNEPDIIAAFIALGPRLRILSDDSAAHAAGTAAALAHADIVKAGASGLRGHYKRFQHDKILVKRVNGVAVKVLTGSTNFSVTGLYVNANHVLVFDDPAIAAEYGAVFDAASKANLLAPAFLKSPISQAEATFGAPPRPRVVASFAPHAPPTFSLKALLAAIQSAQSSVIFAVMDLDGSGDVLAALRAIHARQDIFSYGISDSTEPDFVTQAGTTVYTSKNRFGQLVYSKADPEQFPPPFRQELQVGGDIAHVVHHKFVVVDFNGANPVVFCGSSNLAEGGEEANGDNLVAIHDRAIATAFAIEGVRLVDHYAFAAALKAVEASGQAPAPLRLKMDAAKWWQPYYSAGSIKETERLLFSR